MPVFRTFDYLGRTFELNSFETTQEKLPQDQTWSQAPGAGEIEIEAIALSIAQTAPGEAVSVSTRVNGRNIAFIYADMMLYDKEFDRAYGPVYRKHIPAASDKEIGGVLYPDWEETVHIAFEFTPTLRILTDGVNFGFGFVYPDRYGSLSTGGTYWLNGLYSTDEGQTVRDAKMYLDKTGKMEKIIVAGSKFGRRAPREIMPKPGDQFTPFVQLFSPPRDKDHRWQGTKCLTNTLTFRSHGVYWIEENPIPGVYLLGVIVQDLDANLVRKYAKLTITG